MPDRELLEEYPLYKLKEVDLPPHHRERWPRTGMRAFCPVCNSDQTHSQENDFTPAGPRDPSKATSPTSVFLIRYRCAGCREFVRYCMLLVSELRPTLVSLPGLPGIEKTPGRVFITKVGEWPQRTGSAKVGHQPEPVTGLPARAAFNEAFADLLHRATVGSPLGVLLIDVDRFKTVNDTHGHSAGDQVLRQTAEVITAVVKEKGSAFRYGGDEFAVLLPNHDREESLAVAERIRVAVEERAAFHSVTCTIGVAAAPQNGSETEALSKAADDALYDAKRLGRNLVRAFGEPPPKSPEAPKELRRKEPKAGEFSGEEKEALRLRILQGERPACPKDGVPYNVMDATTMGDRGKSFMIWCPGCGAQHALPSPQTR